MLTANVEIASSNKENVNPNMLRAAALPSAPITPEDLGELGPAAMDESADNTEINAKLACSVNAAKHQPKPTHIANSDEPDDASTKSLREGNNVAGKESMQLHEILIHAICKIVTDVAFEEKTLIRVSDSYYTNGTSFHNKKDQWVDNKKTGKQELSTGFTIFDKDNLMFNNGLDAMLAWFRSWVASQDMNIFEQHITGWWDAQPDHHFMSKKSGCKAENPSECPWPISHDIVAPDVNLSLQANRIGNLILHWV